MALAQKYQRSFQKECFKLSFSVFENVKKLAENPSDKPALDDILRSLDTIIGSARFLENKQLENVAASLRDKLKSR